MEISLFLGLPIQKAVFALNDLAYIKASPPVLGLKDQDTEWVTIEYSIPKPSIDDWIGVFSPANFSASTCLPESPRAFPPLLCTAPIKYQYANYTNPTFKDTGKGLLKLQLINQRSDFSFALFSGGLLNPKLVAVSNLVAFSNPNAPVYPRLAQGKTWNEMTVTWTSGYGINEAEPFVEWGPQGGEQKHSPAGTLTFDRSSMCGAPARTVGWRDPGFIHTSFLKELWPNSVYTYKLGHRLFNVIFGDMGKDEADGSNEYNNFQRGSLNTTKQLIRNLKNIDIVFHIGDICYANGYLSQWDQFTSQIEPIASTVPYMIASGNHERDWPGTGSFYESMDSGGECGVLAETMFYVPADNRAKFWYSTDYGMFRFCIAHTEHDWREGTEQYNFIEHCLASDHFQNQWGGIAFKNYGRSTKLTLPSMATVHNYERTCPVYQNICTNEEKHYYKGPLNGTIHVVAGGGGASLSEFTPIQTKWSYFRDFDYGFVKLTAFDHSNLLFEYKKSRDGEAEDDLGSPIHNLVARNVLPQAECLFKLTTHKLPSNGLLLFGNQDWFIVAFINFQSAEH
ncbi:hypothetical protein F0562_032984 [Nyssa sinensis]|uniref:Purple acid phosphatase n=1 Tax=Nyssa sinensis TaxID=561372 RepID=A0A5J5ARI8_9ASTE|nr:hypothetical protein F0562_032984 [Nyssa sinensis]